jgi:hypothetical protein
MDEIPDGPLSMTPTFTSFPSVPEEMINSIALGLEDDLIVVSRYGMSLEEYRELESQPWFELKVQQLRSEFEKNGVTFKAKAGWMAGELLEKTYLLAASKDASFSQVHDALKTLIKVAGLEPKEEKQTNLGPGFSISIDLGERSVNITNDQNTINSPTKFISNE